MQSKNFKTLVLSLVFVLSFTTLISPTITFASESNLVKVDSVNDLPEINDPLNIITQTDNEIVYEIELDGEKLRYEENIEHLANKVIVHTKVYKNVDQNLFKLIDNFTTEIVNNAAQEPVELIQSGASVSLEFPELEVSTPPDFTELKYDPWTTSRMPGFTEFGFRRDYSTGKAQARYSTMLRSNISFKVNKNFDNFVSEIKSLRSWETAIVIDGTAVGFVQAALKLKKGVTLATLLNLGKKMSVPVATVYNLIRWINVYDSANKRFSTLGGTLSRV